MTSKPPKVKKPYSTPELTVYGNLQQLTATVGNKGNRDSAGPKSKIDKTHFRVVRHPDYW